MNFIADKERYHSMLYRNCGKHGLKLPLMSFGLWHNFDQSKSYEKCEQMILGAFDLGITHFDLANNYGPPPGISEQIFGEILKKKLGVYREEILISTKAGYEMWEGPYGSGGTKKYLLSSLDQSLKRLGVDYVDIFYHHCPDKETPIEETADALEQIVKSGKSLYIGISNYDSNQTLQIYKLLEERKIPCLIHQVRFSMLNRTTEAIISTADNLGIGTIAFCPLAQGLLTNKYLNEIPENSRAASTSKFLKRENVTPEKIEIVRKLNKMAEERGQSLAQMALAWDLQFTTSVILGASSLEQIRENVRSLDNIIFSKEEINNINNILNQKTRGGRKDEK